MTSHQNLNAILNKAIRRVQAGHKDQAIELLSHYCHQYPDNARIRCDIGIFLQQNHMPLKAEQFYRDSLRIDNQQAVIHFNLGVIYQNINRVEQAIDCYRQATEISADYSHAYANLGYLYKQTGEEEKCREACLTAQRLEPDDPQIKHMIASLGIEKTPAAASQSYIKNLYDHYAGYYDQHLSTTLKSNVPELIYKTTLAHVDCDAIKNQKQHISLLDLGCGTGMCGALFSLHTRKMTGIDLSEKMIAEAKKKNVYTTLLASDIGEYLKKNTEKYDIIISSDVLIYFGDLEIVFKGVDKALNSEGLFSFSIESLHHSAEDYVLDDSGRYKHNHRYILQLAKDNKWLMLSSTETALRQQNKENVMGRIYVLKKQQPQP